MSEVHKSTRLGDLLIEQGVISRDQLNKAIGIQQERRLRELRNNQLTNEKKELGEILIELGFIDRRQLHFSLGWQRRLRKTTAVMVFVAPLLTAACGGGSSSQEKPSAAGEQTSSSLAISSARTNSSIASSAAVSSLVAVSSSVAASSIPSMQSSSIASSVSAALDGPVQLYWTTPSQRENGDALDITEIGGYELRYRLKNDSDYTSIRIDNGYADSYYFDHLEGDYQFEIATFDNNGLYSSFVAIKPS